MGCVASCGVGLSPATSVASPSKRGSTDSSVSDVFSDDGGAGPVLGSGSAPEGVGSAIKTGQTTSFALTSEEEEEEEEEEGGARGEEEATAVDLSSKRGSRSVSIRSDRESYACLPEVPADPCICDLTPADDRPKSATSHSMQRIVSVDEC